MAVHDRPSGLTALAVIAFILGGMHILDALGVFFTGLLDESLRLPLGGLSAIITIVLVAMGIGLLIQKRWLGRWVGNLYVVLAIGRAFYYTFEVPPELQGQFSFQIVADLFFPLFTLFLLNVVFRRDLVH